MIEEFYDSMADHYHLIFHDWEKSIDFHASVIDRLLMNHGKRKTSTLLDCACGIGTQALGLAKLGYKVSGSDISSKEIARAKKEAANRSLDIEFCVADFCFLGNFFKNAFDIIIAMDNALPHLTENVTLTQALRSIYAQTAERGLFIASIRDYDEILKTKPSTLLPSVIPTVSGKRIVFQIWEWQGTEYDFTQYIVEDDNKNPSISKFCCRYRALTRTELTDGLLSAGYRDVKWVFPEVSGFYQPIVIARK